MNGLSSSVNVNEPMSSVKEKSKMRVLDLFCGAGGFSEGLVQAGHEIVCAIDNWSIALYSHAINHPETIHLQWDITQIGERQLEYLKQLDIDIVIGSPPCQKFSEARKGHSPVERDEEPTLKTLALIEEINPSYWVLENVMHWGAWMGEMGYKVIKRNAADCGVAQNRIRYFAGKFPPVLFVSFNHLGAYQVMEGVESDWWVFNDSYHGRNGPNWKQLKYPMWTITTRDRLYVYRHPDDYPNYIRKFTLEDNIALQGFNEKYIFSGESKRDKFIQVGNAVPPPLAKSFFNYW